MFVEKNTVGASIHVCCCVTQEDVLLVHNCSNMLLAFVARQNKCVDVEKMRIAAENDVTWCFPVEDIDALCLVMMDHVKNARKRAPSCSLLDQKHFYQNRELICLCKKEKKIVACGVSSWTCEKSCGLPLSCKHHSCERQCHDGECGVCPRSLKRTCPCGKASQTLPCTEDVPPCGSTCGKVLACGLHKCVRSCHTGECGACMTKVMKSCRCGASEKELVCSEPFLCNVKCGNMKQCGRHRCKTKCCDGNCPPCMEICNFKLACGNHRCASLCHTGPCYPCTQQQRISCACGKTSIFVPCGRNMDNVNPPRCQQQCIRPSYCRHDKKSPHKCHFGLCPRCVQVCNTPHEGCGHLCSRRCHDKRAVEKDKEMTKTQRKKQKQRVSEPLAVVKQMTSCPPCNVPFPRSCVGAHEVEALPCHDHARYACKRVCGRMLSCGHHFCKERCHLPKTKGVGWKEIDMALKERFGNKSGVECLFNNTGVGVYSTEESLIGEDVKLKKGGLLELTAQGCGSCEDMCSNQRPEGCTHPCRMSCHFGPCNQCEERVRVNCHCGNESFTFACWELTGLSDGDRMKRLSCHLKCPKKLSCGHKCTMLCHPGVCTPECKRIVKLRCPCKRRKKEMECWEYQEKKGDPKVVTVHCDKECHRIIKEKKDKSKEMEEELKPAESVSKPDELQKKPSVGEEAHIVNKSMMIVASVVIIIVALVAGFFISTSS
eukprot:m.42818 g.42818  ORF g.42818 m.42818 type:complete len:714 (-) comp7079_c0_seq1:187-2328(-)